MKVRELLTALTYEQLRRLCGKRGKSKTGKTSELLERLARYYRGNVEKVVQDLRREDLLAIGNRFDEQLKLQPSWRQLPVDQMRRTFTEAANDSVQSSSQSMVESLTLYSSQFNGSGSASNLYKQLRKDVDRAKRVTVITAYYSESMVKKLLNDCRGEVRVVVNGLGGRRLYKQIKGLKKLAENLRAKSNKAEFKLSFSKGIFHPKLYLFEHSMNSAVWIGSANATKAALRGHNEEILMRISSIPASLADYAEHVWDMAQPLEDCVAPVNSLIAFFRTGRLYYKPYAVLPMSFNPFLAMMKELPEEQKRKISKFKSRFAEFKGGIGAFNIYRGFEEHHREDKEATESRTGENGRVFFRNFAIETTYGYWVSEEFIDEVDNKLEHASKYKKRELERLRDWLRQSENNIVQVYSEYLEEVENFLKEEEVKYPPKYQKLFKDKERIKSRIITLTRCLDKRQFERYYRGYVSVEVPELWEDESSRKVFEDSFFDSLAASSLRDKKSKSAKTILEAIDAGHGASAQEIQDNLEQRLKDGEWQRFKKENFSGD